MIIGISVYSWETWIKFYMKSAINLACISYSAASVFSSVSAKRNLISGLSFEQKQQNMMNCESIGEKVSAWNLSTSYLSRL